MNEHSGVSAIVLAAGMSTRMGSVKQLLRIGDRTLLQTVLDNIRQSRVDEIVVVLGFSADAIQREVALDDVTVVINEAYREGMGTSVRAGVARVSPRAKAALIVLADQPFVRPETINRLIEQYHDRKPQIAIPVHRGFRGNPVLVDRSIFPELLQLAGDIGCRAIFGSHPDGILKVPVDDIGVLLDADTAADFDKFRAGSETLGMEHADLTDRQSLLPQLVVVGQDEVALAVVKFASLLHFDITVVDPFLTVQDLPGANRVLHQLDFSQLPMASETYVVVASRGRFDEDAIEQALRAGGAYVALVANRKRAQEIVKRLGEIGCSAEKLRAPAGLDIGAESPEEIALSVVAEIVSERHRHRKQ